MPQYSSTATTPSGIVINTVYDSDASTITYTATAQNGTTVSATQQTTPSGSAPISSDTTSTLFAGLNAAGANLGTPSGFLGTLKSTQTAAKTQASQAAQAATATDNPVPENPAPPTSTNNQADPAVAPAPNNTPAVESPSPPAAIPAASDPGVGRTIGGPNIDNPAPATVTDPSVGRTLGGAHVDNPAPATVTDPGVGRTIGGANIDSPDPLPGSDTTVGRTIGGANIDSPAPVPIDPNQDPAESARLKRAESAATTTVSEAVADRQDAQNAPTSASNKLALRNTQSQSTDQNTKKFKAQEDWRVRLSLAPGADYLYKVGQNQAGILNPLQATDGVIFPYTPAISVAYNAAYDATDITHSNYKFFTYKNSAVDTITLTGDFTAQDTTEANYLLAVIHFFRSVTKMFYGKDQNPKLGTPPPLCYLSGLGAFQFDWHPLVITNFTYTLPTDVDYIRAMDASGNPGVNTSSGQPKGKPGENLMSQRMAGGSIQSGALAAPPQFSNNQSTTPVTYVPTKMTITITASPIITRNDVSNNFSLKDYATGKLLRGSQRNSGGFW